MELAFGSEKFHVGVVQAAPVAFDRERTLEKVDDLARQAAAKGARLVLFPEDRPARPSHPGPIRAAVGATYTNNRILRNSIEE